MYMKLHLTRQLLAEVDQLASVVAKQLLQAQLPSTRAKQHTVLTCVTLVRAAIVQPLLDTAAAHQQKLPMYVASLCLHTLDVSVCKSKWLLLLVCMCVFAVFQILFAVCDIESPAMLEFCSCIEAYVKNIWYSELDETYIVCCCCCSA